MYVCIDRERERERERERDGSHQDARRAYGRGGHPPHLWPLTSDYNIL